LRDKSTRFYLVALALLPLLANWPVLSGWLTVDPVYRTSGLGMGLEPGPLAGTPVTDGSDGWTSEALGRFAAKEWMSRRIPWWNPYNGPGLPLVAEGQNPALFLPFVLLLALPNGLFLLALALQEIAAFATYALLRHMNLGRAAAWAGGALFCLNGTFAWLADQPTMPIAFAPLLLLGVEMEWTAAREQWPSRGWMVAAVALALSLYAAFPETAYIDGLLGAAWAAQRLAVLPARRRLRFVSRVAGAAVTGVLLAAPYLVPFAHMLTVSEVNIHGAGLDKIAMFADALPVLSIPYVLGPETFAGADATGRLSLLWVCLGGYVPVPELVMAVAAMRGRAAPHRGLRLVLGAWIAAVVGTTFGVPGVMRAVYAIPGLAQVWVFRYAPPSCELAAAVLAAMAIDDWQKGRMGRLRAIVSAVLVGVAVALSLRPAWNWVPLLRASVEHYVWWLATSIITAAVAVLVVVACIRVAPTRHRFALGLAAVVGYSFALFMVPRLAGLRAAKLDEPAIAFLRDGLGLQRYYAMGPIVPNFGAYFGIASLNSLYVPNPQIWSDHIEAALDRAQAPFFFYFTGMFPTPSANIAQFVEHLPAYAALAVRYAVVPAGDDTLLRLASSGAQPLRLAYEDALMRIFEVENAAPYFEAAGGACRVSPQSRERVVTECERPTRLIRRELFFDGWRATVNGKRVDIEREGIVQAVAVPRGTVTVSFRYLPPYLAASAALGLLGLVILSAGAFWQTRHGRV